MANMRNWICPKGHVNPSSVDRCQVCGGRPWGPEPAPPLMTSPHPHTDKPGANAHAAAVEQLLEAYRKARAESVATRWRDEVMNDIRRSGAAARDALNAVGSPYASSVDTFLKATEREDTLLRTKRAADKGIAFANAAGTISGVGELKNLAWPAIIVAVIVGFVLGLLLVVNLAFAAVAALPIGFVLSRMAWYGPNAAKSIAGYLNSPNEGRQLIDRVVVPAESRFFATVQGRPPLLRSTTISGAADKGMVGALVAAGLLGGLLGILVAAGI